MEEEGTHVEGGGFRIDRDIALAKLASFQLEDEDLLVPWIRLAVERGAHELRFDRRGADLEIRCDGSALPEDAVRDPFSKYLGSEERPPLVVYLAAGLLGLSRLGGCLRVESGDGRRTAAAGGRTAAEYGRREAAPRRGTLILVGGPDPRKLARALAGIAARRMWCPTRVLVEGRPLPAKDGDWVSWREEGREFRMRPAPDPWGDASSLRLWIHGAAAQTLACDTPWAPIAAEVRDDALVLDASLSRAVEGNQTQALLKILRTRVRELVYKEAVAQSAAAPRLMSWRKAPGMHAAWAGKPFDVGALRGLLRWAAGVAPPPQEDYESLRRAAARVRWLRACVRGRLNSYEGDSRDKTRRALWKAPLFMNSGDGWLSMLSLQAIRRQHKALVMTAVPGRSAHISMKGPAGSERKRYIPTSQCVLTLAPHDAEDLERLFPGEVRTPE
ncbi:MAG: hypothetical protein A2X36_09790 [Elusimicrobia bacterium GWA2_69_24]|nr:MAG: hypothetical protein A2X36_09790 [Elusimicrobia bacterium GWA2_69_24]HBL15540.1 hypothetical protein [Elusimicrobiota bacterium]